MGGAALTLEAIEKEPARAIAIRIVHARKVNSLESEMTLMMTTMRLRGTRKRLYTVARRSSGTYVALR